MRALILLILLGALAAGLLLYLPERERERAPDPGNPSSPASTTDLHTQQPPPPSVEPAPRAGLAEDAGAARAPDPSFLRGRVLDPNGAPVAQADVYLVTRFASANVPIEVLDPEKLPWVKRTRARTDGRGRFEIEAPSPDDLRLGVCAPGFAPLDRAVERTALTPLDLGDILLHRSVILSGHVLDGARWPLEGASIRRLQVDAIPAVILNASEGDVVATTDAEGAFRIDQLASGPWRLLIRAEGHPTKLVRGETAVAGEVVSGLEFVLDDGAEIRGRVLQASPKVLEELWIRAVPKSDGGDGRLLAGAHIDEARFLVTPQGARCDAGGNFTLRGLTRGVVYRLAARASESDFFGRDRSAGVDAAAGDGPVELVYQPVWALVFQALDASSAQPVPQIRLQLGSARLRYPDGRVRAEGVFEGQPEAVLELVLEAQGYETLHVPGLHAPQGQDLDLGVLRMVRTATLDVRVLADATGQPVVGAQVTLTGRAQSSRSPVASDDQGLARMSSLPGERVWLRVQHDDFAPFTSAPLDLPVAAEHEESVRLLAGGSVVVEVSDALGAPAQGVRIRHLDTQGQPELPTPNRPYGLATDAKGRLTFEHLALGTHTFELERSRVGEPPQRPQVEVSEGSRTIVPLVVPTRGRLSGRVTEAGQPLSGATLRLAPRGAGLSEPTSAGTQLSARTNGQGEYSLGGLELGDYDLSVVHPGRAMAFERELRVDAVQGRFDVDLPLATIEGRLVDAQGRPVAGLRVRASPLVADARATDERSADARVLSDADGRYVLRGLRCDVDLVVTAGGADYQPARSQALRVSAGETRSGVDLELLAGATLEVSLRAQDGRAVPGWRVRALCSADGGSVLAEIGAGGVARLQGLRPGAWRVRLEPLPERATEGAAPREQSVDVRLGETARLRFELEP